MIICDINPNNQQKTLDLIASVSTAKQSPPCVFVKTDVSIESEVKNAVDMAESTYGKLNIIFNNAGIMHPDDDNAMTTDEKVWDLTFNVNVKGVWFL